MKIMIFGATMKTLSALGKCSNKFCGTSPSGKTFLKYLTMDLPIAPGKFVGRNLEQIQVEGCQPHICVQLQLGANFALTAKLQARGEPSTNVPAGDDSQS